MRPCSGPRAQGGFTFIECVVVIVILGLGLLASVGSLTAALVSNQKASDMQLAGAIAQDTIEQMRSQGFGNVTYDDFPASSTAATYDDLAALHDGRRTIVITDSFGGDARVRKVAVTVTWRGRNGKTAKVLMETMITNRVGHLGT